MLMTYVHVEDKNCKQYAREMFCFYLIISERVDTQNSNGGDYPHEQKR